MVHGRVENGALALGAESGLDTSQLCIPCLAGSIGHGLEVPNLAQLHIHVLHGVHLARGRECHLHLHVVARPHLEGGLPVGRIDIVREPVVHWLGELHTEIHDLVAGPALAATVAHEGEVVQRHHTCLARIVAHGILQVDDDAGVVAALGEDEAIHGAALRSRHLAPDAEALKQHAVIARHTGLLVVAVAAAESLAAKLDVAIGRHQADVAQVATTGAAQVHLAETDNLLSVIVISGTPVPAAFILSGAGIHHTERHAGTQEHVSVVARANHGIHILRQILNLGCVLCRLWSGLALCLSLHGAKQQK